MAQRTGLEPATPGVTGRYSNQLNYRCAYLEWWVMTGSNRRPSACKADALPAELITLASQEGRILSGFSDKAITCRGISFPASKMGSDRLNGVRSTFQFLRLI